MFARLRDLREVRVIVADVRSQGFEFLDQHVGGRLTVIIHIGFVGEAENEDFRVFNGFGIFIERAAAHLDDILGHGGIDFSCELDEARVLIKLARLPCQVKWINRDTVAAEPGAGVERHETKRLGFGRLDDFPNVDAHGVVDNLELVDQSDVDRSKDVFE